MTDNFAAFWKLLSPDAVLSGRTRAVLTEHGSLSLPQKVSKLIPDFGGTRYRNTHQQTLSHLSSVLIEDIPTIDAVEREFLDRCYCAPGGLSKHALISESILVSRYKTVASGAAAAIAGAASSLLNPEVWAEAVKRRPVIILGDGGVGKTTFIKRLLLGNPNISATDIIIHVDFGTEGTFDGDVEMHIVSKVISHLDEKYGIEVFEHDFVREVWASEIAKFKRGLNRNLFNTDPDEAERKLLEHLEKITDDVTRHIQASVKHIVRNRSRRVVIVLDNSDQRTSTVQEEVYLRAQEIGKTWDSMVFVALRPYTYYRSKRGGKASAYANRVFTVLPPRPEEVLEKRLNFALDVVEGRVPLPNSVINLKIETVAAVLRALKVSLRRNEELAEFLANITGGNVRDLIWITARFIGSANVDFDKIVQLMTDNETYYIPVHEFQKEILLGEFNYYDSTSSLAHNLFDIKRPSTREHFLDLYILGFMLDWSTQKDSDGFVRKRQIIDEMEKLGFEETIIVEHLAQLNTKNLVENNLRIEPLHVDDGLFSLELQSFRITTIGAYHRNRWAGEFSFLDCMCIDTPILDEGFRDIIAKNCASFVIGDRLDRSIAFRDYLNQCWVDQGVVTSYFNWPSVLGQGKKSFANVARAVKKWS